MPQHHIVADAHHGDVGHRNPHAEADLVVAAPSEVDALFAIANGVLAVAQIEDIDIAPGAAFQHVVACAALQGVVAATANQGVVAGAAVQQAATRTTDQHIIAGGADVDAAGPLVDLHRGPAAAVGEHHAAHPVALAEEPALDQHRIHTVDVLQQHIVANAHHGDVGHRDAGAKADFALVADADVQRVVDHHVAAVAQIEDVDILAAAALEGVIALAAFQDGHAAACADQHIVAGATLQGVVAAAADQHIVAVAAVQQVMALAALEDIVAAGADENARRELIDLHSGPAAAVGEHHAAHLGQLAAEPALDAHRVAAVDVLQHDVVADAHHGDVGYRDARAEADFAAHAHRYVQRVVDDEIAAVTEIEHIDVPVRAAAQGVVALAAVQDHRAAAGGDQHIVAVAAAQGVVAAAANQRIVAVAAFQQIAAAASVEGVVAAAAHIDAVDELIDLHRGPAAAVGEHHAAHLHALAAEPPLDAHRVAAVDML